MAEINQLLDIMRALRDPHTGCPWDQQQTFSSIAPYTLEEAYEVVDAIESEDYAALPGELGDLLLQVVFHAQMATEKNLFDFADVVESICTKLTRRHPHVFPAEATDATPVTTANDVRTTWQQIKQQERGEGVSVLDGVPRNLPALKRAQKLGSRASSIGFDWPNSEGAKDKIREELAELDVALAADDVHEIEAEMGDVLFSLVNLCRHAGIDAESALRASNRKFESRFARVERAIKKGAEHGEKIDLDAMERAWQSAKQ